MGTIAIVLATLAVLLGESAFAQQTTIQVPQGSGVFPTVGQVNCLEDEGSGRYCRATYECSGGVSGALWDDMANHNGRQAIGATSPVARLRDCVVTVDGRAAVRWMTGYRPNGREGDLVGLTTSAAALRPVVRGSTDMGDSRSLLAYILERQDTTLAEIVESDYSACDDVPFRERDGCTAAVAHSILNAILEALGDATDNPANQCLVDTWENYCDWAYQEMLTTNNPSEPACQDNLATTKFLLGIGGLVNEGSRPVGGYDLRTAAFRFNDPRHTGIGGRPDVTFGNYNERVNFPCRDLAEQELSRHGIGVNYCGEGGSRWAGTDGFVACDSPNEYELTVLE